MERERTPGHDFTDAERDAHTRKLVEKFAEMWVCDGCGGEFLFGRMTGAWAGYCPHCHSPEIRQQTVTSQ